MSNFAANSIFSLAGAVAVVTGGGTGIGLMAAKGLASQGAKVYITGRRLEVLQNSAKVHGTNLSGGGSIVPLQADVTSKDDLRALAAQIEKADGKVHVLINNAGVEGPVTRLEDKEALSAKDLSEKHLANEEFENWDSTFKLNNSAVFFATFAFLPLLEAGNKSPPSSVGSGAPWSAAVINITSISGLVKLSQYHYAYNASKAAANHLTAMLSHELNFASKLNIRVNALAPGLFPSEMTSGRPSKDGSTDPGDLANHANPAGRTGTAEEMASAVLFLATNTFTNGQILAVDGGFVAAVPSTR
ncbi:NAD(P)-binding protein [Ceraceosorus guamensis]|uniref:NAD(P)-binding protein n=1 Tax=Ceraceosorus guamensis TaxID=1522189 RepID=A0A316VZG8_9BASI|nr:NAD(P)-binding protein [Ceraceosorus guamensis]PWN42298.1 NAD(P)-binding protein [Ceraceosorus guamensis]